MTKRNLYLKNTPVDDALEQFMEAVRKTVAVRYETISVLDALDRMARDFPGQKADYLERYRAHCITLGRRVSFEAEGGVLTGTVTGVDGQFGLQVQADGGGSHTVTSGTVAML